MARVLLCRLSDKRLAMLREDLSLIAALREEIREGRVPFALDVGILAERRIEAIAARVREHGPGAWAPIAAVLDGEVGVTLRQGSRVLAPSDVARVARALEHAPSRPRSRARKAPRKGSLDAVADALCAMFVEAAREREHVLVLGPTRRDRVAAATRLEEQTATRAALREQLHASRLRERDMTPLDDRIVQTALHRSGTGLRHPDAEERKAYFWDLHERFFEVEGALRELVVEEIRELVILWAAAGVPLGSRQLAALMLAHVARAIGRGGPLAERIEARLREDIHELDSVFLEIFDEMPLPARAAMALACARVKYAPAAILARISDEHLRGLVEGVYRGDEAAHAAVLEAVEDAILDDRPTERA